MNKLELTDESGLTDKGIDSLIDGRWHAGNGYLCLGTFRIARADFEAHAFGSNENQHKVIEKVSERLNSYCEVLKALKNLLEIPDADGTKETDTKRLAIELAAAMAIGKAEGTL